MNDMYIDEAEVAVQSVNPQAYIPKVEKVWTPVVSESERACIRKDMHVRSKALREGNAEKIEWAKGHLAGAHGIVIYAKTA